MFRRSLGFGMIFFCVDKILEIAKIMRPTGRFLSRSAKETGFENKFGWVMIWHPLEE
jgi:hypothetical protein